MYLILELETSNGSEISFTNVTHSFPESNLFLLEDGKLFPLSLYSFSFTLRQCCWSSTLFCTSPYQHRVSAICFASKEVEYLTELIDGSIPSLCSGKDETRELVRLAVEESSSTCCKCLNLSAQAMDELSVWPCLNSKLSEQILAVHLLDMLPTFCHLNCVTHIPLPEYYIQVQNMPFIHIYSPNLIWLVSPYIKMLSR